MEEDIDKPTPRSPTLDELKMERLRVVKDSLRIYEGKIQRKRKTLMWILIEKWKKEQGEIEYLSEDGLQGIFKGKTMEELLIWRLLGEYRDDKRYGKIKVLLEDNGESYEGILMKRILIWIDQ